jgi:glycerol-3-phosphate acyltransferase PlsY
MSTTAWLIWLAVAFLSGSIPFAVLLGRINGVDIRKIGSGNPGATNLGRAIGKKWGLICFFLDVGKGLVPTLAFGIALGRIITAVVAQQVETVTSLIDNGESTMPSTGDGIYSARWVLQWVSVGIAAVLGHVFSPWLKFRGGKGVATGLGATLGLMPVVTVPGLIAFAMWYLTAKLSGYVGLASVVAAASLPILTVFSGFIFGFALLQVGVFAGLTGLLALLVIVRHMGNLKRIAAGSEPKAAWTGKQ